jgi:hypothetical protein
VPDQMKSFDAQLSRYVGKVFDMPLDGQSLG